MGVRAHDGQEAVEHLKTHAGWFPSTTPTMLRRMTEKDFLEAYEEQGLLVCSPRSAGRTQRCWKPMAS